MPRKSRDFAAQAARIAEAWQKHFPNKRFSGFTLAEFRETFEPALAVRAEIANLTTQLKYARRQRVHLDRTGRPVILRVVHGVRADPEVGEDSAMYILMGYTAKRRRRKPGPKRKRRAKTKTTAREGAAGG